MSRVTEPSDCVLNRRDFAGAVVGAALAARPSLADGPEDRPAAKLQPLSPGIKISLQVPSDFTDEDLVFARQLGVGYVSIPTKGGKAKQFVRFKQRV